MNLAMALIGVTQYCTVIYRCSRIPIMMEILVRHQRIYIAILHDTSADVFCIFFQAWLLGRIA